MEKVSIFIKKLMYIIEFYAWIGHHKEIDTEEPQEYFTKNYTSLNEAKSIINTEKCLMWNEGEWTGCYITISFKRNPKIYNADSILISECKIVDWKSYQHKWIDIT
jgi:hypothetical protein